MKRYRARCRHGLWVTVEFEAEDREAAGEKLSRECLGAAFVTATGGVQPSVPGAEMEVSDEWEVEDLEEVEP